MRVAVGIVATIVVLLLLALFFAYSGTYNIAASEPHAALVKWYLNTVQRRSIEVRADRLSGIEQRGDLAPGYVAYASMCVLCHGSPTQSRWPPARHMVPMPPALREAAAEWSLNDIAWVVEHGIKMSAMPAFGATHTRNEIVRIARFVDTLPDLTVGQYVELTNQLSGGIEQGDHEHEGNAP